jgi:hypothetical protein
MRATTRSFLREFPFMAPGAFRSFRSGVASLAIAIAFAFAIAIAIALSPAAVAGARPFVPVPKPETQTVQSLNGRTIVSASGTGVSVGASVEAVSARKFSLLLAVKNTGAAPLDFGDGAFRATAGDTPLKLQPFPDAAAGGGNSYADNRCVNATAESLNNCNIDSFNRRQHERMAAAAANAVRLAPGELATRQFQFQLPKDATALTVGVEIGGERIAFDFKPAD